MKKWVTFHHVTIKFSIYLSVQHCTSLLFHCGPDIEFTCVNKCKETAHLLNSHIKIICYYCHCPACHNQWRWHLSVSATNSWRPNTVTSKASLFKLDASCTINPLRSLMTGWSPPGLHGFNQDQILSQLKLTSLSAHCCCIFSMFAVTDNQIFPWSHFPKLAIIPHVYSPKICTTWHANICIPQ